MVITVDMETYSYRDAFKYLWSKYPYCSWTIWMSCLMAVLSLVADGLWQCAANIWYSA
jgi:hypothetical protein